MGRKFPQSVSSISPQPGAGKTPAVFRGIIRPMPAQPSRNLEVFPNTYPDRDYEVRFECPEFTCLCPRTGQPDFATLRIVYIPDHLCVELKSLKLYLWSYRNEGAFHEAVTNQILDDLVKAVQPRWMEIEGDFYVRGGIHTVVKVTYRGRKNKTNKTPTPLKMAASPAL